MADSSGTGAFEGPTNRPIILANEPIFRLGPLIVDPRQRRIEHDDGRSEFVEPRVMQVLVALVRAKDLFLTRDDLAYSCWEGRIVGDDAINRTLSRLRRVAEGIGAGAFRIETLSKVGYRLVPELVTAEATARVGYSLRDVASANDAPAAKARSERPARRHILSATLLICALSSIGLVVWRSCQREATVGVAVAPAAATPESTTLARDLTAKLGMLSSVTEGPVRLLDRGKVGDSDLLFQVEASPAGREVEASLVLLSDRREVLWSKDLRRPQVELADLKQQLAFTAGTVLQCALEATSVRSGRLDRQTLKIYLNACAAYADVTEDNYRDLRAQLARVTQLAPRFEPAWRRLLVADSGIVRNFNFDESLAASDRVRLEQTVAASRRVNPTMPEIYLGQAVLAPVSAFSDRLHLIDRAVETGPDDAELLKTRSIFLMQVGRLHESVDDMRSAARLDALSPTTRQDLVATLASAGKLAEAKEELRKAEQVWPGAAILLNARYFVDLRFGDPKEAIRIRNSGALRISGAPLHGSFLEARASPTPTNVEKALRDARSYFSHEPLAIVQLSQALVAFGREDELFAVILNGRQRYDVDDLLEVIYRPAFRKFHHDPRMMRVAARLGLLGYWRTSGKWPDFCFDPDLPYDCQREARVVL
jgi:DNA-binding winged helix-turn-helix (wHTH) protein/tetratricopeptide (TPR) repeat protein